MFNGSLVALITPFDSNNRVDYDALKRLIDFHVERGTQGLVVAGTTGESATLVKDEHVELIQRSVELAAGRLPIIAGTGSNSTAQTINLSRAVQDSGIESFLVVVPYYNKPTQEGLFRHFTAIADAVSKPLMLYNVPGRTVADMLPDTVARLAEHENIFGIKEATGDIERLKQIQALANDSFRYYSGDDFTTLPFIRAGGHGIVTVAGNVAPREVAELCSLAAAGDADKAEALDERLQPLNKALFLESNPIPVKWALCQMGLAGPGIRLPLTELDEKYHDDVRSAMRHVGIDC
ncbi:MAG: 4-hydroxy-tetrahydrodipicolinate synthase [Woeseiaceae bacterium]|nr:4-hydroxy-tetrahydrodipicolinate synthase [Woeseiaceae bacterium]